MGGTRAYPYRDTLDDAACNKTTATVPVGSKATCEGGFPGLFDLSGNVREWEDSCDGMTDRSDICRARGGSIFSYGGAYLSCGFGDTGGRAARDDNKWFAGFRCCHD